MTIKGLFQNNYHLWVSLTAHTIILYAVLVTMCSVIYFWYKKRINKTQKKTMSALHVVLALKIKQIMDHSVSNVENDLDISDNTEEEDENDDVNGAESDYTEQQEFIKPEV
eukprot:284683_1